MEISVKTVNVNGHVRVYYNGEKELVNLLKKMYTNQGNFYEKEFGVSFENAISAEGHPKDNAFQRGYCDGWTQFLQDRGKITKTITEKTMEIKDILFPKEEKGN